MLIERKGADRAPLYFPFKDERAPHFLAPLFAYLRARGARGPPRARGRLLVRPHDGVPRRAAGGGGAQHLRHRSGLRRHARAKVEELGLTGRARDPAHLDQDGDAPAALGRRRLRPGAGHRRGRAPAGPPPARAGGRVLPGARAAAATSRSSTRRTARFPWRRTRWGCRSCSGCRRALAWRYARLARPGRYGPSASTSFVADGTGWRNATWPTACPRRARAASMDVTEDAGYGWRFFRDTARSRTRRALLPPSAPPAGCSAPPGGRPSWRCRTSTWSSGRVGAASGDMRIEIGERNYLAVPAPAASGARSRCCRASRGGGSTGINRGFNERIYSGEGAAGVRPHPRLRGGGRSTSTRRGPGRTSAWAAEGYGRALELGAGSGYFTTLIARRADPRGGDRAGGGSSGRCLVERVPARGARQRRRSCGAPRSIFPRTCGRRRSTPPS